MNRHFGGAIEVYRDKLTWYRQSQALYFITVCLKSILQF